MTGGAGFIGSNLIQGLNQRGVDDIVVVDDFKNSFKHRNLNHLKFRDIIKKSDFFNKAGLFKAGDVEAVFHQGACTNTVEFDGNYMLDTNYYFSRDLLTFCLERRARLIYASSAAVYGTGERGFREEPSCEDPLNIYGFSKLAFDQVIRRVLPECELQIAGLRYFNVYGPGENHKGRMASVMFQFFNQAKTSDRIKLFQGSENFKRDFIFVDDVVKVNLFLFDHPEVRGIFNCGTGRVWSFAEVAQNFQALMDHVVIETIPFPEELEGKYQAFTKADLKGLRAAGYDQRFHSLLAGMKKYVNHMQKTGGHLAP